jgi:hypothetical protein
VGLELFTGRPAQQLMSSVTGRIEDLAGAARQDAYFTAGIVCELRKEGTYSEAQIAGRAGFGTPEAMYVQLKNWGLSGLLPGGAETTEASSERKARQGGGEAEDLPAVASALDQLRLAVDTLISDLGYVEDHREVLQDGRFVASGDAPPDVYVRDLAASPEQWAAICAEHGRDPAITRTFTVRTGRTMARGASPFPNHRVVRLIAAALLVAETEQDVEALLGQLHPRPEKADRARLRRYLTGEAYSQKKGRHHRDDALVPIAKRLASLVRGAEPKRGLKPGRLSPLEHAAALELRDAMERGVPEEEITARVEEAYGLDEAEISRLRRIFPPP